MKQWWSTRILAGLRAGTAAVCLTLVADAAVRPSGQPATAADAQIQQIRSSIEQGRYLEAEAASRELLSVVDGRRGRAPVDAAPALDVLVEALVRNGRGSDPQTRVLADRAIEARAMAVGAEPLALAESQRNLGDVLVERGDYELARAPYNRALALRERALGLNHPAVARDLGRLARALTLAERYDEALAAADRALAIDENAVDRADAALARTLEVRALLFQRRGAYAEARTALERAVAIREAVAPHPDLAATLSLFAEQLVVDGEVIRARAVAERAVELAERMLRPDHPDLASYLRTLAIPVGVLGDLAQARALRERALGIADRALGADHPGLAVQLNDVAGTLYLQGEYAAARRHYERARQVYERRLGPDHSNVVGVDYNLAIVNTSLGDFAEARRYYTRVVATWSRVLGAQHPLVARARSSFGEMLSDQGLHLAARAQYERALAIRERSLGPTHRDVARVLSRLATTVSRLGQSQQGEALSARALAIWEGSDGRNSRDHADALLTHGRIQAARGEHAAAERSYDRALSVLRQMLGPTHPDVAEAEAPLAAVLAAVRPSDAIRHALSAEAVGRNHLRLTLRYLPERQALSYAEKRPRGLALALSLLGADGEARDAAYDAVIRGRTLILDEMAERRRLAADAARPDVRPLWTALGSARMKLANLVVRGPGARPDEHRAMVAAAQREKELAERAVADRSAAFQAQLERGEVGLAEVRAALPAGVALVSFVRYDRSLLPPASAAARDAGGAASVAATRSTARTVPAYMAFVLTSRDASLMAVELGRAVAIDAAVAAWRQDVVGGLAASTTSAATAEQTLRIAGESLRRRIWDPIAPHLKGAARVLIVADGTLSLVPLAALPVGRTRYLLEDGPLLHYLSAERDMAAPDRRSGSGAGLLVLGGPAFEDGSQFAALARAVRPPARGGATDRTPSPTLSTLRSTPSCLSFQSLRFDPLAGTRREAEDVGRLWQTYASAPSAGGAPLQVLIGRRASERAFKQQGPGQRILHLATHGFFLGGDCTSALQGTRAVGGLAPSRGTIERGGENPLLLSGLALAGANRRSAARPEEDDGILTAEEVASLNLDGVEWAVLSACDTGLGRVQQGEGVFGLRRAFQVAGARTVIMSLWPVEDQAGRVWMTALYRGRLGQHLDTATAMQQASLTVLRDFRARGRTTHPFFWAGFVAAGDWR